jgi:hypothetical protein
MKKIVITMSTQLVEMLDVTQEDSPNYPLLDFTGFGVRVPSNLTPTSANYPRKTESAKGNVDVLIASTSEGWATKCWPFSVFLGEYGEELFDHRHLLKAVKENSYTQVPVAFYERKLVGDKILDSLSNASVLTLMGLFVNATDGTVNAVQNDFVNAIKLVIEDEELPLTLEVVETLLGVTGASLRYSHKTTITSIKNAILDHKTKSTKVFNTTKEEQQQWIKSTSYFGSNNYSEEDGVALRAKTIDNQYTYRYAGDVLRLAYKALAKREKVRVIVSSMAEHESIIEKERAEFAVVMEEIFSGPINFFREKIQLIFGDMIKLPQLTIADLPVEIWAMPQIEGEVEAIQLL